MTRKISKVSEHSLDVHIDSEIVNMTRYEPVDYDGENPVILIYTPYRKDDMTIASDTTIPYLAERGYEVVVADMVGTGGSTGLPNEPFSSSEGKHAAKVVQWLSDQEWSNGKVGMYGKSYPGVTALEAAAQQPEALKAIIPIHAPNEFYSAYYEGNTFSLYRAAGSWAPNFEWTAALPPSRRDNEGRWSKIWKDRLDQLANRKPYLFQYLDNDDPDDDYWKEKEIPIGNIETPTFAVGGWRDAFPKNTIEYFNEVNAEKRLLLGPWRHTMPHEGEEVAIDFHAQMLEWFDFFLKNEDNGALDGPDVTFWTENNSDKKAEKGIWRTANTWDEATTDEEYTLALTPTGLTLHEEYTDGTVNSKYKFDHTVGIDSMDFDIPGCSPVDTSIDDNRSLCFETDKLTQPVETTGSGSATIRFTPTTSDPILAVRIVDVLPTGESRVVTHGQIRAISHSSFEGLESLTPGEEYTLEIPLKPRSYVFESGHKIRVSISAAFFPLMLPTREQGSFTVHSSPDDSSNISLSAKERGSVTEFTDIQSFNSPNEEYIAEGGDQVWETQRNYTHDSATLRTWERWESDVHDAEMEFEDEIKTSVKADDPLTAFLVKETEIILKYPNQTAEVTLTDRVARDTALLSMEVRLDDQVVYSETNNWDPHDESQE